MAAHQSLVRLPLPMLLRLVGLVAMVVQTLTVRQLEVGPVEEAIFAVSPLKPLLVDQGLPARTT